MQVNPIDLGYDQFLIRSLTNDSLYGSSSETLNQALISNPIGSGSSGSFDNSGGGAVGSTNTTASSGNSTYVPTSGSPNTWTGNEINTMIPNSSIDFAKLTIDTLYINQSIKGGATGYDEGVGFWLGNDGDDYKFFIGDSSGDKVTWDGSTLSITGSLTASDIHIPDTTTDDSFHVNSTGNMWIGCNVADYASAEENAEVYFHNDGTGFIKTTLQVGESSTDYLTIDGANQKIVTNDYVSGVAGVGWSIDSNLAEFANIYARGKISTAVFQKDVISSVGGNLIVLNSDVLATDIAASDTTYTISGDSTFAVHDVLRMKDGIDDEWAKVTDISSAPTYGVLRNPDTNSLVDEMDYATNALIQAEWSGKTKATLYANTEISDCDSATGWSSFAGISNISLNTTNQLEGTGCIEADFASGNSNIQKSLSSLDISAYYGTGFIILPVYLPNVTNLTYFRIWVVTTWNTDYDNFQVTTDINGDAFKVGWNILSFDTSSPNASVGTIDPTDINLIYFQNPETWNATDVLIDHIALYPTEINPNFSMVIEDCDATTDWSGGNIANLAVNTDYRLEGTGCLSFDTTGAGGEAMLLQNALALDVSHIYGDGYIIFPIYLPSITGLSGIEFHISSTWASDRDYKTVTTDINGNALKVGWNIISIDTSNMSHAGTFDPTAVDAIRIDLNGSLATTGVLIDDIQLYLQEEPNKYLAFTDPAEPILNSYWGGFMNNAPNVNWYWVASPTSSDVSAITGVSSGAPTNGRVGFWIKTDNNDIISNLRIYLGSGAGDRIYLGGDAITDQISANNTDTFIELDLTDFTTTGTPDWTAMDYAAFDCSGSEPFQFLVSDIRFYGDAAGDTWKKGATVVSYGQPDEGGLLQTASESNAPYMSIFTHDGEPWDGTDTKARLGNLAGITDTTFGALSGYGLWTDSGYFTGSIFATAGYFGDSTNRVAIEAAGLNVGSTGALRGGQTAYETGTGFWMGNDSGTYKLSIGSTTDYFKWTGTNIETTGIIKSVIKKDAGENIAADDAVYLDASSGDVYKTDATDVDKIKTFVGIALNTATTGNSVTVQIAGVADGLSGLTTGSFYYLTDTAGEYSTVRGTYSKRIGQALSATELQIDFVPGIESPKFIEPPYDLTSYPFFRVCASDHTEYPRYIYLFYCGPTGGTNQQWVKALDTANGLIETKTILQASGTINLTAGIVALGDYVYHSYKTGSSSTGVNARRYDLDGQNPQAMTFRDTGGSPTDSYGCTFGYATDGTYFYTGISGNIYQWVVNGVYIDLQSTSAYTTMAAGDSLMDLADDTFYTDVLYGTANGKVDYFDGTASVTLDWWGGTRDGAPAYAAGYVWINGIIYAYCIDGKFREYDYRNQL